jgi:hypothetical protein
MDLQAGVFGGVFLRSALVIIRNPHPELVSGSMGIENERD